MEELELKRTVPYREKIYIPLSIGSIGLITLILSIAKILKPIQSISLLLFTIIPLIISFLLYMSRKGSLSKYFHLPLFLSVIAYIIFFIANIYLGNINSFEGIIITFYDFLIVFFLSFSSTLIVYYLLKLFFKNRWDIQGKKYRILTIILLSTIIPIIIIVFLNWINQMVGGKI